MANEWKRSGDLLASIHDAYDRVRKGETPVDQAHAEARILGTASRVLMVQLEHARLTGRLTQGSDELPDFGVGKKKGAEVGE